VTRHEPRDRLLELRARLQARAQQPLTGRVPVTIGALRVGSAAPDLARYLAAQDRGFEWLPAHRESPVSAAPGRHADRPTPGRAPAPTPTPDATGQLRLVQASDTVAARSAALDRAARALRAAGMLDGWRDEQLDVRAADDSLGTSAPVATIERAACRALGITTFALHLNAFLPDGRLWIAQRAAHKAIDPGCWDSLVGGMQAAGETERQTLEREAAEEAGLALADLTLAPCGRVVMGRPVPEGWQSEVIVAFNTTLGADTVPINQDGEVQRIEAAGVDRVLTMLEDGVFSLEAALVTIEGLLRGSGVRRA
jgi:8-oxo-dGTP pyrophosphatase MutT (NUDIX family)